MNLGSDPRLPATDDYYPWLDPLRFFAALSVVAFHLRDLAHLSLPQELPGVWFAAGFLGVDLFFAISGAVIYLSIVRLARRHGEGHWRAAFMWRRVARLVPLYVLTTVFFVCVVRPELVARSDFGFLLTTHLLFVSNLFASTHGAINGVSWSLGVEMQFYLLMVLVGAYLLRRGIWLAVVLAVLVALLWRLGVWQVIGAVPAAERGNQMFIYTLQLPGVLDGFAAGIVAMWWRLRTPDARMGRRWIVLLGLAVAMWWLVLSLLLSNAALYWSHPAMLLGLRAAIALASGLSVAAVIAIPNKFSPGAVGQWMGDTSYGIYLWHLGVLLLVVRYWPQADPLQQSGVILFGTTLLASLGWVLVERPILRWARRWPDRKTGG